MKKTRTRLITIGAMVALSCNNSGAKEKFLPPSTGGVNSLMVVMDTEMWRGTIGDKIREHFADQVLGLPQGEPIFSITQIPPRVFKGAVTRSRSILFVEQDTVSLSHIKTNVYATPQKVAVIKGKNYSDLAENVEALAESAIAAFKRLEITEAQKRFMRSLNKEKAFEEEFGISLNMPSSYKVGKREKNFVWADIQIPKGTMNIIAYTMPWDSFSNDSTFVGNVVKMRDSIGEKYVPGPSEDTFMATEKAFAPYVLPTEIGGKKAVEARGIWEMSGYPMAGPFLTYIINDRENNRRVVLEGFTFAPSTEKRDYMFELEAILRTIKFDKAL